MDAAIYVPRELELWRWWAMCHAAIEVGGWHYRTLIRDWHQVVDTSYHGPERIIVTPSVGILPPGRLPRLVAADDMLWTPRPRVGEGRPRRPYRLREPGQPEDRTA